MGVIQQILTQLKMNRGNFKLNKKTIIIALLFIIIAIALIIVLYINIGNSEYLTDIKNRNIVYRKDEEMASKQGISLNYNEPIDNISYIEISDKGRLGMLQNGRFTYNIHDKEKIKEIIDYINALELIEDELIIYNYNYDTDLNKIGYFTVFIQTNDFEHTLIEFETNYLTIIPSGMCDCFAIGYYIKDSGYDPLTANSKTFKFLYDFIHENS